LYSPFSPPGRFYFVLTPRVELHVGASLAWYLCPVSCFSDPRSVETVPFSLLPVQFLHLSVRDKCVLGPPVMPCSTRFPRASRSHSLAASPPPTTLFIKNVFFQTFPIIFRNRNNLEHPGFLFPRTPRFFQTPSFYLRQTLKIFPPTTFLPTSAVRIHAPPALFITPFTLLFF